MTKKRFIVDDCGTLIDMQTKDNYDYVSDVCDLLNELHKENEQLKLTNRLLLEEMKEIRDKLTVYLEIRKGDYND